MKRYRKAIVAVLGGVTVLLGPVIPGIESILSEDAIQAIAVLATSAGVYAVPNAAA